MLGGLERFVTSPDGLGLELLPSLPKTDGFIEERKFDARSFGGGRGFGEAMRSPGKAGKLFSDSFRIGCSRFVFEVPGVEIESAPRWASSSSFRVGSLMGDAGLDLTWGASVCWAAHAAAADFTEEPVITAGFSGDGVRTCRVTGAGLSVLESLDSIDAVFGVVGGSGDTA